MAIHETPQPNQLVTVDELKGRIDLRALASTLLGDPGYNRRFKAVWRGGEGHNVAVYEDRFVDYGGGGGSGGDAITLIQLTQNLNRHDAIEWLREYVGGNVAQRSTIRLAEPRIS